MNNVPEPITVSITVLNQMFLYLNSLNVAIDAFLRSLDVDPTAVKQPDTRIPIETYLLIQDEAARYTNDPSFGRVCRGRQLVNPGLLDDELPNAGRSIREIGALFAHRR